MNFDTENAPIWIICLQMFSIWARANVGVCWGNVILWIPPPRPGASSEPSAPSEICDRQSWSPWWEIIYLHKRKMVKNRWFTAYLGRNSSQYSQSLHPGSSSCHSRPTTHFWADWININCVVRPGELTYLTIFKLAPWFRWCAPNN